MGQSKKQRPAPSSARDKQVQEEISTEEEVSTEEEEDNNTNNNNDAKSKPKPQPSKSGTKRTASKKMKSLTAASSSAAVAANEKKSGPASKLFQRFWSEDDELVILKGMAEFLSKKGQDPYTHCDSFLSFVKDSLHVDPTTSQLKDKIQRFKKRFQNNSRKGTISNPHEQKIFELSKKVWDRENSEPVEKPKSKSKSKSKPKPKPKPEPEPEPKSKPNPETKRQVEHEVAVLDGSRDQDCGNVNLLFREMFRSKELNEDEVKRRLGSIQKSKRKELEEKWKDLRDEEIDLAAKRTRLIADHVRVIVESLKSPRC